MTRWTGKHWGRLALTLVFLVGLAGTGDAKPGHRGKSDNELRSRSGKSGSSRVKGASKAAAHEKLDKELQSRAGRPGSSRVIVMVEPGGDVSESVKRLGGKPERHLRLINAQVAEVPNGVLNRLAHDPAVASLHHDRPTEGELNRVAVTVGARTVHSALGYRGTGIGVAVIDSGITTWHDDLTKTNGAGLRVSAFADFLNGRHTSYDDNGHGTHVAGIIAGNGFDSLGSRAGIAPGARIIALKVLDRDGRGVISSVIAALDYAVTHKANHNIRVVNLSVGAAVTESYWTDPLTIAAKRASDAGIIVVAAAGNLGKTPAGATQYGAITAPGNAPWVITVGASNHNGTVERYDDAMAGFSSRGPTAFDYAAKPDLVAPGVGTVSLSDPTSLFYAAKPDSLLSGSLLTPYKPYLALSGTSMSAPVVAGAVALMVEANPSLTPNLAKAILQYTAERRPGYNELTQGAGFVNAHGAVQLARFLRYAQPGATYPSNAVWSKQLLWGNHRISGGVIKPSGSAWQTNVVWGASEDCQAGQPDCENIVWGTQCADNDPLCENIVWGSAESCDPALNPGCENIVWGSNGEACDTSVDGACENIVWGSTADACDAATDPNCDNIVWGTQCDPATNPDCDNIVWGSFCGGGDCENIVWGSYDDENIVWGSTENCDPAIDPDCDNIVWGSYEDENIVWGSYDDENIVWGSIRDWNIVWGSSESNLSVPLFDDPDAAPVNFDATAFESLFAPAAGSAESTTTTTVATVVPATGGGL